MKHLKTFESFSQSLDEGFLDDFIDSTKKIYHNLTTPEVKPQVKKKLIDFVKKCTLNLPELANVKPDWNQNRRCWFGSH